MLVFLFLIVAGTNEPERIDPETFRQVTECYDKKATPWINGSYSLKFENDKKSYTLSGQKSGNTRYPTLSIAEHSGKRWILIMIDRETGLIDLGSSNDPEHAEYQPNPKFVKQRSWFISQAVRITQAVAALCKP